MQFLLTGFFSTECKMAEYLVRKLINAEECIENCSIITRGSKIVKVEKKSFDVKKGSFYYAVPGFIDIHTHGRGGGDVMDSGALFQIARSYLDCGTTTFLASTVSSSLDRLETVLEGGRELLQKNKEKSSAAEQSLLLGYHLEGPWISEKNSGAHDRAYIAEPDQRALELIEKFSGIIRMVTFSYHSSGAKRLLECLNEKKIIAACGHDETIDSEIVEGFKKGLNHVTHIYSNTSSFQRAGGLKHLGTLEMALMTPGISIEVIADGRHITRYFWDFILHNKSVDDIVVVSDSISCAGLSTELSGGGDSEYRLGDRRILIENGVAWLPDRSTFAGSISSIHSMFCRLVREWSVPIQNAVRMTSSNQARILNVAGTFGVIGRGATADILFMNEDLAIQKIVKSGIEVGLPPDREATITSNGGFC